LYDNLRDYQITFLRDLVEHRRVIGLWARQMSKTTCVAVFFLWFAMFKDDKTLGIVSNKESSAKEVLKRIKLMYENLPAFIKPGIITYNMKSVLFENGTEIIISATTPDAFRGRSIQVLLMDEIAFVKPKSILSDFWSANFPALSASKESKIIAISTPNGLFDLFHSLWAGAELGKNGFKASRVRWDDIEGRDEAWKQEQMQVLSEQEWRREYECEFLGSANTVINYQIIEVLFTTTKEPIAYDLKDRLRIWKKPEPNFEYVMGVDTAKGTGEHYSSCQVLRIDSYTPFKATQVANFNDNLTDIYDYGHIIYRLAVHYNNAHVVIENNSEGAHIVNTLWWDYEYSQLVNEGETSTKIGVRATNRTKPKAVLSMKKLIESGSLTLHDMTTIRQLGSFIDLGNNKFAGQNMPDDLVSALYWACYITDTSFDVLNQSSKISDQTEEDSWGILSDVEYIDDLEDWM